MAENENNDPATPETPGPSAPDDKAIGEEKVDDSAPADQKISGGAGHNVYADTPLVEGIPVVVPIMEGTEIDPSIPLVKGIVLSSPPVEGVPEMISNAQAERSVDQPLKPGTIRSLNLNQGQLTVAVVAENGSVIEEVHNCTPEQYDAFTKALEDPKGGQEFFKENFNEETRVGGQSAGV